MFPRLLTQNDGRKVR